MNLETFAILLAEEYEKAPASSKTTVDQLAVKAMRLGVMMTLDLCLKDPKFEPLLPELVRLLNNQVDIPNAAAHLQALNEAIAPVERFTTIHPVNNIISSSGNWEEE